MDRTRDGIIVTYCHVTATSLAGKSTGAPCELVIDMWQDQDLSFMGVLANREYLAPSTEFSFR